MAVQEEGSSEIPDEFEHPGVILVGARGGIANAFASACKATGKIIKHISTSFGPMYSLTQYEKDLYFAFQANVRLKHLNIVTFDDLLRLFLYETDVGLRSVRVTKNMEENFNVCILPADINDMYIMWHHQYLDNC